MLRTEKAFQLLQNIKFFFGEICLKTDTDFSVVIVGLTRSQGQKREEGWGFSIQPARRADAETPGLPRLQKPLVRIPGRLADGALVPNLTRVRVLRYHRYSADGVSIPA
jgi:hypothetical protein